MRRIFTISLLVIIAASMLFVGCKKKAEEEVITVATDATWPPMEYINEDKEIVGFALRVEELTAEESIRLQEKGIGGRRRFGCGIFVPERR